MPEWHWRTFPVYFAFAVGGFLGLYMGTIAAGVEHSNGNSTVLMVCFGIWAILVGFGFSRLTSRFMMSRGWARPRSARKK